MRPNSRRRYKVQKQINLHARDRSNKPFLLGIIWRTIAEADRKAAALATKKRQEAAYPDRTFRVVEEWPFGSDIRPL